MPSYNLEEHPLNSSLPLTLWVYVEESGNVTYGIQNGNFSYNETYADLANSPYSSGYFYVANRAGSDELVVTDLKVGH